MNIFAISKNPYHAVQYYCDQHVTKMTLETAQLLGNIPELESPASPMSGRHICDIAIKENQAIVVYTIDLQLALLTEFRVRFAIPHAYDRKAFKDRLLSYKEKLLYHEELPKFPLAFSPAFRQEFGVFETWVKTKSDWINYYRRYYEWKLLTLKTPRYFKIPDREYLISKFKGLCNAE